MDIVRCFVILQGRKTQIMMCGKQQREISGSSFEGGLMGDVRHEREGAACR